MAPKTERPRFNGADDDLAKALSIASPRDIQYAEDPSASVNVKLLLKQKKRLQDLHQLQANLSFNKSQVKEVLKAIAEKNKEAWRYDDDLRDEFVRVVTLRLTAMCRHVAQARQRKTKNANLDQRAVRHAFAHIG